MNDIQSRRYSRHPKKLKTVAVCILLASASFLVGCSHSPTFNLLGSYFPAWMICAVVGGGLHVCDTPRAGKNEGCSRAMAIAVYLRSCVGLLDLFDLDCVL